MVLVFGHSLYSAPPTCTIDVIIDQNDGCAGAATGAVSAFAHPGNGTYALTGPVSRFGPVTSVFLDFGGLPTGDYTLTLNTSNPVATCVTNFHMPLATVTGGPQIILIPNPCQCDGGMSLAVTGVQNALPNVIGYNFGLSGANGFSQSISTDASTPFAVFSNLCGSNYTWFVQALTVDDTNETLCAPGLTGTQFLNGGGPTPAATITGNTTYNTGDLVQLIGGPASVTPPGQGLTYLWTGPNFFSATTKDISFIASALTAGPYQLTVCNNSNGEQCCTTTSIVIKLNNVCTLEITNITTIKPACIGQSDGSVQVTFSGGTGPFFYQVDGGAAIEVPSNPFVITNLSGAFPHTLSIVDSSSPQCTAIMPFTVDQQQCCNLNIDSIVTTVPGCVGQSNGQVQVSFSGGTAPYFYQLDGGPINSATNPLVLTGLSGGTSHMIIISDSSVPQCTAQAPFTVQAVCCLTATASNAQPSCPQAATGSVDITVSGASGQIQYSLDGGSTFTTAPGSSFTISGLPPGNVSILIRDTNALSCMPISVGAVIDFRVPPTVTIDGVSDICGVVNPTLTANPAGGAGGPYTFLWSTGEQTQQISPTGPGVYSVTVTDAVGCTGSTSVTVTAQVSVTISAPALSICPGQSILLTALPSPLGTYAYTWTLNGSTMGTQSSLLATQPGTYTIQVTDPRFPGCVVSASVDIVPGLDCKALDISLACPSSISRHDDCAKVTITVTNTGNAPVNGIAVTDILPPCFSLKSASGSNWVFGSGSPLVATYNEILQRGQSSSFTLYFKVKHGNSRCACKGSATNTVVLSAQGIDDKTTSCTMKIC